jgi:uncharacterized protein YhhL (DUF1145 family)
MYNVLYMLRRLLITFVATILKQDPYLQVQLIVLHSVFMIIYLTYVKPFELPLLNYLEIFNEYSILLATYHLFCFTGFVPDPEYQYQMGWSIIVFTILNMAVNVFIMLYKTIMSLKIAFFKIKRKYLLWKMSKAKKD